MEGIYPQAKLQIWDASPAGLLTVGGEIDGLSSAVRHGRGVINLSLGGFDRIAIEEHAILAAFGAGSLVVASAGNDRQQHSPPSFPASFAHVLTIGATDESNRATYFSSSSPDMDLAAPGQDMIVAVPTTLNASGYELLDGTSFSAPLVSGASAAVWTLRPTLTNTQLFEVMRRSAHQVSGRGWNRNTGYGILDVNAALAHKAPAADPQEPNEDVYLVKPNGIFKGGRPLDRYVEPDLRLADTHAGTFEREALHERVGNGGGKRLEQLELPARGDLSHELDDLAVVDGLLQAVGWRLGQFELEVEEERLVALVLLGHGAVATAHLEAGQLAEHDHPRAAAAAVSASTWSRTSWTRRIVAPRS